MKSSKKQPKREMTADGFESLPRKERERIFAELDAQSPEERIAQSKPLNAGERAEWRVIQKHLRRGRGRPKVGKGVARVSLSVERTLLDRADAYAKSHRLNRSELVSASLAQFIGAA